MRNIGVRTLLWIVAVPAIVALIMLIPGYSHLGFNLLVFASSALGARELSTLFERHDAGYRASIVVIPILGLLLPVVEYLIIRGFATREHFLGAILTVAAAILFMQLVRRDEKGFGYVLSNIGANFTLLLYPGLFMSYIVRLSAVPESSYVLLTFVCAVFFNDTIAYLTGSLGARLRTHEPRLRVPISPNKTLSGFIGGFLASPLTVAAAWTIFPSAFPFELSGALIIGAGVGVATILGDLIESALKRASASKDSGTIIPGRGGILDSIDSVLYAAPVFYYLFAYLSL